MSRVPSANPWTAAVLSLAFAATACNTQQRPPQADESMCVEEAAPEAPPACGPAWCEEHQIAEADCRICHPDGGPLPAAKP